MKIISWNVNGIRAVVKKGFLEFLKKQKPDILCLQEIKISDAAREKEKFNFLGYEEYWNSAERPGYSGTAILVKSLKDHKVKSKHASSPSNRGACWNGIGIEEFDKEGRAQILETKNFYLLNCYFPNANHELSRLNFKMKFNGSLLKYAQKLEKKKPVIITGDFNVAHKEIDLARPKDNVGSPGFTYEERGWLDKFLKAGFIDAFRYQHPEAQEYSWWSYRFNARMKNIGWRIDYFCVSAKIIKSIKKTHILKEVYGSDHCPVVMEITV